MLQNFLPRWPELLRRWSVLVGGDVVSEYKSETMWSFRLVLFGGELSIAFEKKSSWGCEKFSGVGIEEVPENLLEEAREKINFSRHMSEEQFVLFLSEGKERIEELRKARPQCVVYDKEARQLPTAFSFGSITSEIPRKEVVQKIYFWGEELGFIHISEDGPFWVSRNLYSDRVDIRFEEKEKVEEEKVEEKKEIDFGQVLTKDLVIEFLLSDPNNQQLIIRETEYGYLAQIVYSDCRLERVFSLTPPSDQEIVRDFLDEGETVGPGTRRNASVRFGGNNYVGTLANILEEILEDEEIYREYVSYLLNERKKGKEK